MMLYPQSRPGVTEPALVKHLCGLRLQFVKETLPRPGNRTWPLIFMATV
jgi:hypothetical protein